MTEENSSKSRVVGDQGRQKRAKKNFMQGNQASRR